MNGNICPEPGALVEVALGRIATEYREADNFLALLRATLGEVEKAAIATCKIPEYFDIDTATGDQLTLLGKALGWPRCHCVCEVVPVYGVPCPTNFSPMELVGPCDEATWIDCDEVGSGEVCFEDDEIYRRFLKVRRYQILCLYDIASLQACIETMWGGKASVLDSGSGKVIISTGRDLSPFERLVLPLAFRVLPIAPGIRTAVDIGPGLIAGFGTGWGGSCDGSRVACPIDPHPYDCA